MRALLYLSVVLLFPANSVAQDLASALPQQLPEMAEMELAQMGIGGHDSAAENSLYEFPVLPEPKLGSTPNAASASTATRKSIGAAEEGETLWLKAMQQALLAKGAGEQIALDGVRYGRNVRDARQEAAKWTVQDIVVEKDANRFSGKLVAEGKPAIPFRGRFGAMQMVPVLNHALDRGATVTEGDIAMKPVLAQRVRAGTTLVKPEQVLGKKLKRMVKPGQPIRAYDIDLPDAVTSNSEVEMVYTSNGVFLIDRGFAMESGSVGDVIRVRNAKSGNILRAKVDAENRVIVNYFDTPKQLSARTKGGSYALN